MDFLPIELLFLLVGMSGAIAYAADRVGKKLGKKRLTFMGLRPKHTATLFTVLLGISVSLLTIVGVALLSSDVRVWITQGRAAIRENAKIQKELGELRAESEKAKADNQRIESQNSALQKDLAKGKDALSRTRHDVEVVEARRLKLQARAETLRRTILDQQRKILAAQHDVQIYTAKVAKLESKLTSQETRLAATNKRLQIAYKQSQEADQKNSDLIEKTELLREEASKLQAQILKTQTQRDIAEQAKKDAEAQLASVSEKLELEKERLDAISQQYRKQFTQFYDDTFRSSRTYPLMFRFQQEITRLPIEAGLKPGEAENAVTTLLRMARSEALSRGAEAHQTADRKYDAAEIYSRRDPATGREITPDEIRDTLIRQITGQRRPLVLLAVSGMNVFRTEPVPIEVAIQDNPVVYHRGDVIIETLIDGRKSEDRIYQQVIEFLTVQVRAKALKDLMIPREGDGETFGRLPITTVYDIVRQIKATSRISRVQALTEEETRAADLLRLELRLR